MAFYATDFSIAHKHDDSPVSEADIQAEHAIAECLAKGLPDVPIVAEEAATGGPPPADLGTTFLLVDPLDGTKEFISRNGEFTINAALIEDGTPVAGVVIAPAIGLAYAASCDRAWKGTLAGEAMRIEGWAAIGSRRAGEHAIAVASRSHMNSATANALAMAGCREHRSIGSSLKFGLLAEGAADLYPRLGPTMEWDTAAGDAVLRAAGGAVVTLDGAPLRYGKRVVAGKRDFENPYFVAVGDRVLLKRLDLAALKPTKAA